MVSIIFWALLIKSWTLRNIMLLSLHSQVKIIFPGYRVLNNLRALSISSLSPSVSPKISSIYLHQNSSSRRLETSGKPKNSCSITPAYLLLLIYFDEFVQYFGDAFEGKSFQYSKFNQNYFINLCFRGNLSFHLF